ncbi:efflux RND transporter periplasmic adaptor subunit [Alteromonas aestuariivivens]|uniref:Efflux RND transporter periplasmic adaptor subunit n=1 Tax=Alteromonas aestuariivivens TaxID=1938339 RepID=A0A3D8M3N4_9ALTE|nr:efflux RND transporter periplasmic adaptor subunit [Alteromonas aestuariivivens]RDV24241.1 efflux RND transporter periplasmic adaptor subunit [Alteromonas aestuariivivens]
MKWIKYAVPFAILGLGYAGMKGIEASANDDIIQEKVDTRPTVTIEHLEPEDFTVQIASYGEVQPLESTRVAAQVAGEIVSWNPNFVPGGLVKRGELLFSIEKDSYEAALLQAEASLSNAQALLIEERARAQVARREAASLPSERVTDLYLRKPQVLSAEAAVKSAEAMLRIAKRDLQNCDVTAPYDALVVSREIGVGDFVNVGTSAAVLNNIEMAEIKFPVAGFDSAFLPESIQGKVLNVQLDAHGQAVRKATIHRDLGMVDQATRMIYLVARINDPYSLRSSEPATRFGTYATVTFAGKTLEQVYRVPQELITRRTLWTLDDEDKLVSQKVQVIREEGGYFYIRGDFNSDRVVMTLPEYPQQGMAVKVLENSNELVATTTLSGNSQ